MAANLEKLQQHTSVDYMISGNFPLDDTVFESKLFTIFASLWIKANDFVLLEIPCCFERMLTLWKTF